MSRYSYITKRVFLHLTNKDLWEKGKNKKQKHQPVRRIAHPRLPGISERPEAVNQREDNGHWEIDLVVGKAKSRPVLLTMIERKKREPMIFKLPDRQAASVRTIFDKLERKHRLTMVNTPLCKALGVKNQIFHSKEIQSPVA